MNIYREVVNRIEIPALPSLESGYYLLRFERNGTTSNVYCIVENESGMGVPITASLTEIGTGTPDPEAGEVLLAPGAWTLFFYEQVSGTNTNPDCSTIPLGQTEVTVYGEDAEVLSQTPTTCPSGPGGEVTAAEVTVTPFFSSSSALGRDTYRDNGAEQGGKPIFEKVGGDPDDDRFDWIDLGGGVGKWQLLSLGNPKYEQTTAANTASPDLVPAWSLAGDGALPLPVITALSAADVQGELERQNAGVPAGVYEAALTQVGTAAPTAVVFTNTTGRTVTWSRTDAGIYIGTFSVACTLASSGGSIGSGSSSDAIISPSLVQMILLPGSVQIQTLALAADGATEVNVTLTDELLISTLIRLILR